MFNPNIRLNNALEPYVMHREMPLTFALESPYPNPFNPTTRINYSVALNVDRLSINIYDIRGRLVDKLYRGSQVSGRHHITWNASSSASGIYFVRMDTDNYSSTEKLMLIK